LIGLATALGKTLTAVVPIHQLFFVRNPYLVIALLFLSAAIFKVIQGSSMATFAAVAPIAAPIMETSNIFPILTVYSIALGSFVTLLPNDSF